MDGASGRGFASGDGEGETLVMGDYLPKLSWNYAVLASESLVGRRGRATD